MTININRELADAMLALVAKAHTFESPKQQAARQILKRKVEEAIASDDARIKRHYARAEQRAKGPAQ